MGCFFMRTSRSLKNLQKLILLYFKAKSTGTLKLVNKLTDRDVAEHHKISKNLNFMR